MRLTPGWCVVLTSAAAETVLERHLPGVSFAAARAGLLDGSMLRTNGFGAVAVTRHDARTWTNRYTHPRGGPTVERCAVVEDATRAFALRVDAESPRCPLGDRFATRVDVAVEQRPDSDVVLRAVSAVAWRDGWPHNDPSTAFVSRAVERAAERGAAAAYATYAAALVGARGAPAAAAVAPGRGGRVPVGALVLGAVAAALKAREDSRDPPPSFKILAGGGEERVPVGLGRRAAEVGGHGHAGERGRGRGRGRFDEP